MSHRRPTSVNRESGLMAIPPVGSGTVLGGGQVVKYWWQKPKMEDGDDMLKDPLEQEGKEIGITLNAAGTGILLQLGEVPTCHKCELHAIRVTLNRDEAATLKHTRDRLIGCLPEPPNEKS